MSRFRVGIDIELPAQASLSAEAFPHLAFAVQKIAERGVEIWQGYASGAPLPDGKVIHARSGAYMRSIHMQQRGDFSAEVLSEIPYAEALETGSGPRDLKTMLATSLKVRISKTGKRYLIIPFRHGTPGAVAFQSVMPQAVHDLWRGLRASRVTLQRKAPNLLGVHNPSTRSAMMITRRKYKWGSRLAAEQLRAAGARGRQLRNMSGMVHMQNPGGGHGQYLTFRVMSEDSRGWITQGRPAMKPAQTSAEQLRPLAEKAFTEALKRDIERLMGA